MKKIIVILVFAALIIVFGLEKVVFGIEEVVNWVEEVVERSFSVKLSELQEKDDVYCEMKTQKPYSGKYIDTYRKNVIKEKGTLKGGKRDGEIKVYYENGNHMHTGHYKNGKQDGEWKHYYKKGNLKRTGYYKNGEQDGEWKHYYEDYDKDGKLMRVENYKDGEPEGRWEHYDVNIRVEHYIDGKPDRESEHYDENVRPIRIEYLEVNYIDGKPDEKWEYYGENRKRMSGSPVDQGECKEHKTVTIGSQIWMAENLNYAVEGSKCYNNSSANCDKYGSLYNWSTAMALPSSCDSTLCSSQIQSPHRGICPSGWHIPSYAEWDVLVTAVGGYETAGTKLKATSGWNNSGNGTDEYGFSALPGGSGRSGGSFDNVGNYGRWWSATENDASYAYNRYMHYLSYVYSYKNYKSSLFSVRCVKN